MRSKNAQMVAQFRHHFGLPVKSFPSIEGVDLDLHEKLLAEELEEFIQAADDRDPVELLDALADLVYVAYGCALDCGFDLDAALAEVHRSNLSKLMPDGTVLRRDDGKVLKGPNFTPPDLRALAGK